MCDVDFEGILRSKKLKVEGLHSGYLNATHIHKQGQNTFVRNDAFKILPQLLVQESGQGIGSASLLFEKYAPSDAVNAIQIKNDNSTTFAIDYDGGIECHNISCVGALKGFLSNSDETYKFEIKDYGYAESTALKLLQYGTGTAYPANSQATPNAGLNLQHQGISNQVHLLLDSNGDLRFTFSNAVNDTTLREYVIKHSGSSELKHANMTKFIGTSDSPADWADNLGRCFKYDGSIHATDHTDPTNPVLITSALDAGLTRCEGSCTLADFQSKAVYGICIKAKEGGDYREYSDGMTKEFYPIPAGDDMIHVALKGDCLVLVTSLTEYQSGYAGIDDRTISIGDLLEVGIDGIIHKQDDDIIRSRTIGKSTMDIDLTQDNSESFQVKQFTINADTYECALLPTYLLI